MGISLTMKGGKLTNGGKFWNMKTGEKVTVGPGEKLPGTKQDTYSRVPGWMLYSLMPIAGWLLADTLPKAIKSIYAPYADTLVFSYVVFVISFLSVVVGLVLFSVAQDILTTRDIKMFGWRPGEAYYSGSGRKKELQKD